MDFDGSIHWIWEVLCASGTVKTPGALWHPVAARGKVIEIHHMS